MLLFQNRLTHLSKALETKDILKLFACSYFDVARFGLANYRFKSLARFWWPLRFAELCAPRKELEKQEVR